MEKYIDISVLVGKTITEFTNKENEEIIITCADGTKYIMFHDQDCCEHVTVDDICGDINDLLNFPITLAEESTTTGCVQDDCESFTWTFYKFATIKGYVDIKWYGSSNGYYSESVSFKQIL